ncbi:MAG: SDR family oxidoreductase [Clostridia bacterium]|nr:SDR family oxidoreductase [Clostridia bacterium]
MNQAVLITGAQSGTGYGIAERFAREGWTVLISAQNREEACAAAERLAQKYGIVAKGYELELRCEQQIIETFKDIDSSDFAVEALVLNAADMALEADPSKGIDVWELSTETFRRVLETNVIGNFVLAREAARRMRERRHGSIVFISSNSVYRANPNREAYIASKGGINAMVKSLAVDLGPFGIRVNVIMPGTIKTERWVKMGKNQISNGELTPIGDISDYEDIANAAWYFGTDMSKNVTGAELVVDGGMSAQIYPAILPELKRLRDSLQEQKGK